MAESKTKGLKLEDVMPLQEPVEPEPAEKPKPEGDALDTPSGHALKAVGMPDEENSSSEKERVRGLKYRYEKHIKRWLS
jgi:hypothetical protein